MVGSSSLDISQGRWNLSWHALDGLEIFNYTLIETSHFGSPSTSNMSIVLADQVIISEGQTKSPIVPGESQEVGICSTFMIPQRWNDVKISTIAGSGGRACTEGISGMPGTPGPDGDDSTSPLTTCTPGLDGHDGALGGSGGTAIGGTGGDASIGIGGSGGLAVVHGGDGGNGGSGGDGGDGYDTQNGCPGGTGGNGGNGGFAGNATGGDGGKPNCGYAGNAGGAQSIGGTPGMGGPGGSGGDGGTLGEPGLPGGSGSNATKGAYGNVSSGVRPATQTFDQCLIVTIDIENQTLGFTDQEIQSSEGLAVRTGYAESFITLSGNETRYEYISGDHGISKVSIWGPEISAEFNVLALSSFELGNLTWLNETEVGDQWTNSTNTVKLADPQDIISYMTWKVRSSYETYSDPNSNYRSVGLITWWTYEKLCNKNSLYVAQDEFETLEIVGDALSYACEGDNKWGKRLPLNLLWLSNGREWGGDVGEDYVKTWIYHGNWVSNFCGSDRYVHYYYGDDPNQGYAMKQTANFLKPDPWPECFNQWHVRVYRPPEGAVVIGQAHYEDVHWSGWSPKHFVHDIIGSRDKVDAVFETSPYGNWGMPAYHNLEGEYGEDELTDHTTIEYDGLVSFWFYDWD